MLQLLYTNKALAEITGRFYFTPVVFFNGTILCTECCEVMECFLQVKAAKDGCYMSPNYLLKHYFLIMFTLLALCQYFFLPKWFGLNVLD